MASIALKETRTKPGQVHGGSFTTIHADTARKAIDRLAIMVMAAGLGMGFEEVKRYCASSIDLVVQLGRHGGARGVAEIEFPGAYTQVRSYD